MKTLPDITLRAGESVNLTSRLGLPTTSSLILQSKGSTVYVNNDGTVSGFKLVNSIPQQFNQAPLPLWIVNPSFIPVTVAVLEIEGVGGSGKESELKSISTVFTPPKPGYYLTGFTYNVPQIIYNPLNAVVKDLTFTDDSFAVEDLKLDGSFRVRNRSGSDDIEPFDVSYKVSARSEDGTEVIATPSIGKAYTLVALQGHDTLNMESGMGTSTTVSLRLLTGQYDHLPLPDEGYKFWIEILSNSDDRVVGVNASSQGLGLNISAQGVSGTSVITYRVLGRRTEIDERVYTSTDLAWGTQDESSVLKLTVIVD